MPAAISLKRAGESCRWQGRRCLGWFGCNRSSDTFLVVLRARAGSINLQRPAWAYRIGPDKDPVLPGGKPAEDSRVHGFGWAEAQVCFQSGERVGRECDACFDSLP